MPCTLGLKNDMICPSVYKLHKRLFFNSIRIQPLRKNTSGIQSGCCNGKSRLRRLRECYSRVKAVLFEIFPEQDCSLYNIPCSRFFFINNELCFTDIICETLSLFAFPVSEKCYLITVFGERVCKPDQHLARSSIVQILINKKDLHFMSSYRFSNLFSMTFQENISS